MPQDLTTKLQFKPGSRVRMMNAPKGFALSGDVAVAGPGQPFDAAIAFCDNQPALDAALAELFPGFREDGVLWFAYPKGKSGFNRDAGFEALGALGWRGVRMVAIDEVWSAKRVRPAHLVK